MPTIKITTAQKSIVYVDDIRIGIVKASDTICHTTCIGKHRIKVVNFFNHSLVYQEEVKMFFSCAIEVDFRSILREHPEYLDDMELFTYRKDHMVGYIEPITRSIIIRPQYSYCSAFSCRGLAIASLEGRIGVINKSNHIIIPFDFDNISELNGVFRVTKGDSVAYYSFDGNKIIDLVPYDIKQLTYNQNVIGYYYLNNGISVFLNAKGETIVSGNYEAFTADHCDYIYARNAGKHFVFNNKGELLFALECEYIQHKNGLFLISRDNCGITKWGLVNNEGQVLLPLEYEFINVYPNNMIAFAKDRTLFCLARWKSSSLITLDYTNVSFLMDRFIKVKTASNLLLIDVNKDVEYRISCDDIQFMRDGYDENYLMIKRNGKYGCIQLCGDTVKYVTDCLYDDIYRFQNEMACVRKGDFYGAIDRHGKLIVSCVYLDEIRFDKYGYAEVFSRTKGLGIIDKKGNQFCGFNCYDEFYYSEGAPWSRAVRGGKSYLLDKTNTVIGLYDNRYEFSYRRCDGLVAIMENGTYRFGFIDDSGKQTLPCKYDDIELIGNGLLACKLYNKFVLFNIRGKKLSGSEYEKINQFYGGYALAKKETGYGIIDKQGNEISRFCYQEFDYYYENIPQAVSYCDLVQIDYDSIGVAADIEGLFRYDLAYISDSKDYIFIDISGHPIELQEL